MLINRYIGSARPALRTTGAKVPDLNRPAFHRDRQTALHLVPVSREIEERFAVYVDLLQRWRNVTNLISEKTSNAIWTRHIADCAQALLLVPTARRWVDVGSGAGFPGLVIAMQLACDDGAVVHCIESDQRKSAFLREAVRATQSPAIIHSTPVQSFRPTLFGAVDAVTSRALAPLPIVLHFSKVWLVRGAIGVFLGGKSANTKLADLSSASSYAIEIIPSVVDSDAAILRVRID